MGNKKKYLIYCPVFREELRAVLHRLDDPDTFELGYEVHNHPDLMLKQLKEGVKQAQKRGCASAVPAVLVGKDCECELPIGDFVRKHDGCVADHMNCFEIFLGREKTLELQENRTVLMTPGWIQMIRSTLASGLWTVEDARMNLGWYDRILLLDTHTMPISDEEIMEFYDLVQVPIEKMDIELDHFLGVVEELLL